MVDSLNPHHHPPIGALPLQPSWMQWLLFGLLSYASHLPFFWSIWSFFFVLSWQLHMPSSSIKQGVLLQWVRFGYWSTSSPLSRSFQPSSSSHSLIFLSHLFTFHQPRIIGSLSWSSLPHYSVWTFSYEASYLLCTQVTSRYSIHIIHWSIILLSIGSCNTSCRRPNWLGMGRII